MPAEFGRRSRAIVAMLAVLLVAGSFEAAPRTARAAEPDQSAAPTTSASPETSATPSAKGSAAPVGPAVQAVDKDSVAEPEPGPPSDADEREDLRTESSLTFEKADGSRVTEFYPGPINYRDGGGPWLPIDLDFKSDPGDAKAVAVDESPIGLRVAPASDGEGFLTLTIDGYEIHLRPVDAPPARPTDTKPVASGSVADVIDALPGIDLRVAASASGVNSFFILDEADAAVALEFVIDAPGLNLSLDKETGAIALLDRGGTTVASMLAPYAVDSTPDELTGGGRVTSDVRYALAEVDGRQVVTITVDPAWLAKATYPVYVDPTIYNNGSATYGDAHVNQGNPTLNYANYQRPDSPGHYEMWLGESPSDSTYYNEAFIKFDLSTIAGTTIDSANLEVRPYHQYYNAPTSTTTWLRRVTGSWAENTIKWSNKPGVASGSIDTTGCVEGQQCAFAVTALVRGWLDGTYTNYGVRLDENGNGPTYWKRLIASEEQTSTRPRLIVTNHVPVASTTTGTGWTNSRTLAWSYSDSGGHAQSHYEVDVSTVSNFATFVYDGAATAGAGTSFSIPVGTTLTNGTTYHWRVRVKDGTSWSAWDTSTIQWDAAAPTGGTISVNAGATYATSPSVTLNLTATDAHSGGVQMQPSDDGVNGTWVAFAASPAWTLPGADGTKTVYVRYRDAVQNTTGWINDTIVLDTADPTASIAINNGAATTATQSVTLDIGSGDATSGVATTKASNDNSVFTDVTGPAAAWTLTAGDGTKTVWFKVTDNAGRTTTVSDTITLATDTTPPGAPSTPDLDAASDSGTSSTDDVTNDDTPTFSGTAEANSTITIYSGSVAKGSAAANGSGAWTVTTSALTDGIHSITATATDAANNVSPTSSALSVTIDTTAPSAPSTPDLDAASDSGASTTDDVTNDDTPTFTGFAESGTTLTIHAGATPKGSGSVIAGTWTITASSLVDGTSAITARTTDLAGNTSAASSGLSLTVDTAAPASPSIPDLEVSSDTGTSSTDNITNDSTPTLTGSAESGLTVQIADGATTVGSGSASSGVYSITTTALNEGVHSLTATATDPAGNVSSASAGLSATVDTTEPIVEFTTPDAEFAVQTTDDVEVAWTESDTGSGMAMRTLQRQAVSAAAAWTCAGLTFADDGAPISGASPQVQSSLDDETCFRWILDASDLAGNATSETSGHLQTHYSVDADIELAVPEASATLSPDVYLGFWDDIGIARPADEVGYTAQLTYSGMVLAVQSHVAVENVGTVPATIEHAWVVLERLPAGESTWLPFAAYEESTDGWGIIEPGATGVDRLEVGAVAAPGTGVTYPTSFAPIVGTTIAEGSTAQFDIHASIALSSALVDLIVDGGATDGVRQRIHVEVSPRGALVGQPFTQSSDIAGPLLGADTDLTDATIIIDLPTGSDSVFDSSTTPALGTIAPGAAPVVVGTTHTLSDATERGVGEEAEDYLARLREWNTLRAGAVASADFAAETVSSEASTSSPIHIPVVRVTETAAAWGAVAGQNFSTVLRLSNIGGADTTGVEVSAVLGTVNGDVDDVSSVSAAHDIDVGIGYAIPTSHAEGSIATTTQVTWTDSAGNNYGPVEASVVAWVTNGASGAPFSVGASGPADPTPLFGTETILGYAVDETGVTSVELLVDGSTTDADSTDPFEFELDTTTLSDGPHTYQIRAHDGDGHVTTSAPLQATVDNLLPGDLRVQADTAKGILGDYESVLYGVQAAVNPGDLPARYQSSVAPTAYGTEGLTAAMAGWDSLDSTSQDAIADYLNDFTNDLSAWSTPSSILIGVGDYADHCSLFDACEFTTEHFVFHYSIDPGSDRSVPQEDDWQLTGGNVLEGGCGACNGVPDWVDRLAYGFEQSWDVYAGLGYGLPLFDTIVNIEPSVRFLFLDLKNLDQRALSLGKWIWVPYTGNEHDPIYIARHEFFHVVQYYRLFPNHLEEIPDFVSTLGALLNNPTSDPRWFLEATAEWGAHQAELPAGDWEDSAWPDNANWPDGPPAQYAENVSKMLSAPERPLNLSDGGTREYGAFIFGEFLEEWAGGAEAFKGTEAISPDPSVIRRIWDEIGDSNASLVGISNVLAELSPASSYAEALPAFYRAIYLLDDLNVLDDVEAGGRLRDAHTSLWRAKLANSRSDPATHGDPDTLGKNISVQARAGRHALQLAPFLGSQSVVIEPGGGSFLEFKLPSAAGAYQLLFSPTDATQVTASILAFSDYPTPCAADIDVDLTVTWTPTVYLPDECTAITVVLTHTNPISGSPVTVWVAVQPWYVSDTFERTVPSGWAMSDDGWIWRPARTTNVASEVSDGSGKLAISAAYVNGVKVNLGSEVTSALAVGHLSDCVAVNDQAVFDFGAPVYLTSAGQVHTGIGDTIELPDFDPCRPWYIRGTRVDDTMEVRIWQATAKEPVDPVISISVEGEPSRLEIDTFGLESGAARELDLDWIDLDVAPTG